MSILNDSFSHAAPVEDHVNIASNQTYKVINPNMFNQFFTGNLYKEGDVVSTRRNNQGGIEFQLNTNRNSHSGRSDQWRTIEGRARATKIYMLGITTQLDKGLSAPTEKTTPSTVAADTTLTQDIPSDDALRSIFRDLGISTQAPEGTKANIARIVETGVRETLNEGNSLSTDSGTARPNIVKSTLSWLAGRAP